MLHIEAEPTLDPAAFQRALVEVIFASAEQEVRRRLDPGWFVDERLRECARAAERGMAVVAAARRSRN